MKDGIEKEFSRDDIMRIVAYAHSLSEEDRLTFLCQLQDLLQPQFGQE